MSELDDNGVSRDIIGIDADVGGIDKNVFKAVADVNGQSYVVFDETSGGGGTGDGVNLVNYVPDDAWNVYTSVPSSWEDYFGTILTAENYEGRSGDLTNLLETAAENNSAVKLNANAAYQMDRPLSTANVNIGGKFGVFFEGDLADRPTIYHQDYQYRQLFQIDDDNADVVLDGFKINIKENDSSLQYDSDIGMVALNVGKAHYMNIELVGQRQRCQNGSAVNGGRYTNVINITDPNGTSFTENIVMEDGGSYESGVDFSNFEIALSVDPDHVGLDVIKNVSLDNFYDNGLYTYNSGGRTVIWDCVASNCRGGNIRPDGDDTVIGCKSFTNNLREQSINSNILTLQGDGTEIIGCEFYAENFGPSMIFGRTGMNNITLDKCRLHAVDDWEGSTVISFNTGDSYPTGNVDIGDCSFYSEKPNGENLLEVFDADVTIDGTVELLNDNGTEIYKNGGSLMVDGVGYSDGSYSYGEVGLNPADDVALTAARNLEYNYFDYSVRT